MNQKNFWTSFCIFQLLAFIFVDFNIYYQLSVAIFNYQFLKLFYGIGTYVPVRYLMGTTFSFNFLIGPVLMFSNFNSVINIFNVKGTPENYFSYAIPAMLALLGGLFIAAKKSEESLNVETFRKIVQRYPGLPLQLILLGIGADFVYRYVSPEIGMVVVGISNLKFVGFFLHLLTAKRISIVYFLLSYGLKIFSALSSSMFNDLLNLLFFLGFMLAIRFKPSNAMKTVGILFGILLIFGIQIIKFPLRERVAVSQQNISNVESALNEGIATGKSQSLDRSIANVVVRLDQGWVTSSVLANYSEGGFELQNGKHSLILLKSSVLPRFIAPDKYKLGDRDLFNKYSGHNIEEGTSMPLGIISDGFIDYGFWGIWIVFVYGLIINFAIKYYDKLDSRYKMAKLFAPTCLFYAIRPDTDSHGAIGSIIKISFLVVLILFWMERYYFTSSTRGILKSTN